MRKLAPLCACLLALVTGGPALAQPAPHAVDDTGRTVALESPAQRVITLSPHATELVLALNAAGLLVGHVPTGKADQPLPDVTTLSAHGSLDRETVLALRPDLVIAWHSGNRPEALAWLDRQTFAVFRSEPANLAAIARNLEALGSLLGRPAEGRAKATAFLNALRGACVADKDEEPVYLALWDAPPLTIGGRHWLNEVMRRAGLRNGFAHIDRAVMQIEPESRMLVGDLREVRAYASERAGNNAIVVDGLGRPGPGVVEVVRQLCNDRSHDAGRH